MDRKLKVIASGTLFDGKLDCYIVEEGSRWNSQRSILNALRGVSGRTKNGGAKYGDLDRFLERLPSEYAELAVEPIVELILPGGGTAIGRPSRFFVKLCRHYSDLLVAGRLRKDQLHLGRNAYQFISATSEIGYEELFDEACGYKRAPEERRLLRRYEEVLRHDPGEWDLTFRKSLVQALGRFYGVSYVDGPYPKELHQPFGRLYDLILGKDLANEMRRRNIDPEHVNHHQLLQAKAADIVRIELRIVEALARQSLDRRDLWNRLEANYLGTPLQTTLVL